MPQRTVLGADIVRVLNYCARSEISVSVIKQKERDVVGWLLICLRQQTDSNRSYLQPTSGEVGHVGGAHKHSPGSHTVLRCSDDWLVPWRWDCMHWIGFGLLRCNSSGISTTVRLMVHIEAHSRSCRMRQKAASLFVRGKHMQNRACPWRRQTKVLHSYLRVGQGIGVSSF